MSPSQTWFIQNSWTFPRTVKLIYCPFQWHNENLKKKKIGRRKEKILLKEKKKEQTNYIHLLLGWGRTMNKKTGMTWISRGFQAKFCLSKTAEWKRRASGIKTLCERTMISIVKDFQVCAKYWLIFKDFQGLQKGLWKCDNFQDNIIPVKSIPLTLVSACWQHYSDWLLTARLLVRIVPTVIVTVT